MSFVHGKARRRSTAPSSAAHVPPSMFSLTSRQPPDVRTHFKETLTQQPIDFSDLNASLNTSTKSKSQQDPRLTKVTSSLRADTMDAETDVEEMHVEAATPTPAAAPQRRRLGHLDCVRLLQQPLHSFAAVDRSGQSVTESLTDASEERRKKDADFLSMLRQKRKRMREEESRAVDDAKAMLSEANERSYLRKAGISFAGLFGGSVHSAASNDGESAIGGTANDDDEFNPGSHKAFLGKYVHQAVLLSAAEAAKDWTPHIREDPHGPPQPLSVDDLLLREDEVDAAFPTSVAQGTYTSSFTSPNRIERFQSPTKKSGQSRVTVSHLSLDGLREVALNLADNPSAKSKTTVDRIISRSPSKGTRESPSAKRPSSASPIHGTPSAPRRPTMMGRLSPSDIMSGTSPARRRSSSGGGRSPSLDEIISQVQTPTNSSFVDPAPGGEEISAWTTQESGVMEGVRAPPSAVRRDSETSILGRRPSSVFDDDLPSPIPKMPKADDTGKRSAKVEASVPRKGSKRQSSVKFHDEEQVVAPSSQNASQPEEENSRQTPPPRQNKTKGRRTDSPQQMQSSPRQSPRRHADPSGVDDEIPPDAVVEWDAVGLRTGLEDSSPLTSLQLKPKDIAARASDRANGVRRGGNQTKSQAESLWVGTDHTAMTKQKAQATKIADEERKKILEMELDRLGKYHWHNKFITKPTSYRPLFHRSFTETVQTTFTGRVPKAVDPALKPPTALMAVIVSVGAHEDPGIAPYPQATRDGEALTETLLALGFDVTHLNTAVVEKKLQSLPAKKRDFSYGVGPTSYAEITATLSVEEKEELPTKDNILRELSKVYKYHANHHVASLVVVFIGRGTTHAVMEYGDHPVRLMATYEAKPKMMNTFFPVEALAAMRMESTLTVADMAAMHPGHGFALVNCEHVGGRLEFQYPGLHGFMDVLGAKFGVLSSLLIKGFRGKAARDLRLTPNNLNVFIGHRLMALKWSFYTAATPLQTGDWDIAPRNALFQQRKEIRSFRQGKRRMWSCFKAQGMVVDQSAKDFTTVTSQVLNKIRRSSAIHLGEDNVQISSMATNGELYLVFKTKDAFSMGVIEAEGNCRRNIPGCSVARDPCLLRLRITIPRHKLAESIATLKEYVKSKSLAATVYVGVEIFVITTRRAERKMDWAMRVGHLAPIVHVTEMEMDRDQMHRIQCAIEIQAVFRGHMCRKRFRWVKNILAEHQQQATDLMVEWQAQWQVMGNRFYREACSSVERDEVEVREMLKQWETDLFVDLWRDRLKYFSHIVLQSKGRYLAAKKLTMFERRRLDKLNQFANCKYFREDLFYDPASEDVCLFGVLKQMDLVASEAPEDETPLRSSSLSMSFSISPEPSFSSPLQQPTPPVVAVRSRMEIAAWEDMAWLYLMCDFERRMVELREMQAFRPWLGILNIPLEVEHSGNVVANEEHLEMLSIIAVARRHFVLPQHKVPAQPWRLHW